MNTITVAVYMLVVTLPNGGQVQMQDGFTSYDHCLAAIPRNQPTARCVQSGTRSVPLPGHITEQLEQLRQYQEKEKAPAK